VPNSVETIGAQAFSDCSNMKKIAIGSGIKEIGGYAFGYYVNKTEFKYKTIEGFKTYCHKGTAAEQYAKDNGLEYIFIDEIKETVTLFPDSVYKIKDGYIYGVSSKTSYSEFLSQFTSDVTVKDNKGNEVTSGNIGTGFSVCAGDTNITVIIKGDVDSNGIIDSTDYINIKRHILKIHTLENDYEKAADIDKSGKIDSTDYIAVKRNILEISVIDQAA
jgi:hypothetical protein